MRIFCLFRNDDPDAMPWLVEAVDEYVVEENGFPPQYIKQKDAPNTKEIIVEVSGKDLIKAFAAVTLQGVLP
jgi:hypothetical protein